MASYVVVMYLGRVMEQGPVDDIFHAPKHPYTRALLRSIPSLYGETAWPAGDHAAPCRIPSTGRPAARSIRAVRDVMARCSAAVPSLEPVGDRQLASCFLHHDEAEPRS